MVHKNKNMHNLVLSPVDPAVLINDIAAKVTASVLAGLQQKKEFETTAGGRRIATAAQAAKYLHRPISAIYQMVHRGCIQPQRMPGSRKLYFDLDAIDAALKNL